MDTARPFRLPDFLPYRLAVLSERVSRRLSVEYGRMHGLSVAEWRVLVHLQRSGPLSVRDIHLCVNLDKPRVSRAVARLEAAGFVRKGSGQSDGRLVSISLAEAGQAALDDILPVVCDIEARLLAQLTAEEVETLYRAMDKIHSVLDSDPDARPRSRFDRKGAET